MGGAPEYWSPEQANHFAVIKTQVTERKYYQNTVNSLPNLTMRIDVYAFGLIIWEILEAKRAWIRGDKIDHLLDPYLDFYDPKLDKNSKVYFKLHPGAFKKLRELAIRCLSFQ